MTEKTTTNVTITMSKEELKALRFLALDNDCSVSALVREWIKEHKEKKGNSND